MCNSSVDVDGLACVSVGIETVSMNDERAIEYAQTIMRLANTLKLSNLLVSVFYVCICVCACVCAYVCACVRVSVSSCLRLCVRVCLL